MHLKRQKASTKLPIPRKGTTYIVRPRSNIQNSVSVLVAVRDILKLARNAKEVKKMIYGKALKLNGKPITDHKQSIALFNIFEADKPYLLTLLPTKKFSLQHIKNSTSRNCKVIGKKLTKNNQIQLNCHDGTNVISKEKISIGDSLILDFNNKIKKHIPLEKGSKVFIFSGKYIGYEGNVKLKNGKLIHIEIPEKKIETNLNEGQVLAQ